MEKIPAALIFLACLLMLVRLLLRPAQRQQLDAAARRSWLALKALPDWRRQRRQRQQAQQAQQEALAAIERAQRRQADWDGNVARPRHFRRDDEQPPTLH
jgi:hypothetical protein